MSVSLLRAALRPLPGRPPVLDDLLAALDGERVGRNILGDDGAGTDVGPGADRDRRHHADVGADEGPVADPGLVLVEAVVVAGDRARPDVHALPDRGVA